MRLRKAFACPFCRRSRASQRRLQCSSSNTGIWPTNAGQGEFAVVPGKNIVLQWLPIPAEPTDFVAGMVSFATCGDARAQHGAGVHLYAANRSMR